MLISLHKPEVEKCSGAIKYFDCEKLKVCGIFYLDAVPATSFQIGLESFKDSDPNCCSDNTVSVRATAARPRCLIAAGGHVQSELPKSASGANFRSAEGGECRCSFLAGNHS